MGGKRKKCRKERAGSVAANPDNLGSNKEDGDGDNGNENRIGEGGREAK